MQITFQKRATVRVSECKYNKMFANPAREIFFWRIVTIQQIVTSANFTRYTVAISFVSRMKRKVIHVIRLYEMGFKDINISP